MNVHAPVPSKISFIVTSIFTTLLFPVVIFLAAGTWRWLEGWIFCIWMEAMVFSNYYYLYRNDPALLAERSAPSGAADQKKWDRVLLPLAYFMFLAWLLLIPMDAKRFAWSPAFPIWIKVIGGFFLLPAIYFIYFATAENTFLSTKVRIQAERRQRVISSGVYGFVRHPLYLGVLLMLAGVPFLTGSLVGLTISLVALLTLVGRIIGEEKMLLEELEGYQAYTRMVKYRLIPFIW
jgi:protein-S-isoprenylcysteine O-methyltransferase Ste14